jgi:hypothetical protein
MALVYLSYIKVFFHIYITIMPEKKRKIEYSENTDPVDGDKNVSVSDEISEDTTDENNEEPVSDDRYSPAAGN